jgi:hypothetical protein
VSRVGAGDIAAGVFIVAVVYVLVRPQSAGAELVEAIGSMMVALVKRAADL